MRNPAFYLIILLSISANVLLAQNSRHLYEVTSVDSIEYYYVIQVLAPTSNPYTVLSKKLLDSETLDCQDFETVEVGKEYLLLLKPLRFVCIDPETNQYVDITDMNLLYDEKVIAGPSHVVFKTEDILGLRVMPKTD